MKRILFTTSFDLELNNPYFRQGTWEKTLIPLARMLPEDEFEVKYLIKESIFNNLKNKMGLLPQSAITISDQQLVDEGLNQKLSDSYAESIGQYSEGLVLLIKDKITHFMPDVIIAWEMPTQIIRDLFPGILVIDLMPGFMSRPPYPNMISLDAYGIYKNSWYSKTAFSPDEQEIKLHNDLRNKYREFYSQLGYIGQMAEDYGIPEGCDFGLIPLQITNYFGFEKNCKYDSQYSFLLDAIKKSPLVDNVVTQYTGGFISEKVINDDNLQYINSYLAEKKLHYVDKLNSIDSISQYLLPFSKTVVSVSSTLGLQAAFYGVRLISPSSSHLKFVESNPEKIIQGILSRGQFFVQKALKEQSYFSNIIIELINKKENKEFLLPSSQVLQTTLDNYLALSNFKAAENTISKVYSTKSYSNEKLTRIKRSMDSAGVSVISFDVFDTLLRRTVGSPEDVFYLMGKKIKTGNPFVDKNFMSLRVLAERLTREERDKQLAKGLTDEEEITIFEIYQKMEVISGAKLPIAELISLEQEVEYSVLKPKSTGQELYSYAKSTGKPICIISDFVHPIGFVQKALQKNGYDSHKWIFVSSESKLKKHSGDLFKHVLDTLKINPTELLHIGDNSIGDIQKPRDFGIRADRVLSSKDLYFESIKERAYESSLKQLYRDSGFIRQIISQYVERFFLDVQARPGASSLEFISNAKEFGYIALGPLMFDFAEKILETAESNKVDQVLFFARDCYLPYLAAQKIIQVRKLGIKVVYLPVSRKSSTGIDIIDPRDVLTVRVDDYAKDKTIQNLLKDRFLVDAPSLHISSEELSVKLSNYSNAEITRIVYQIISDNWNQIKTVYEDRRKTYSDLIDSLGVDRSKAVLAVDVGYKGSIHKKLSGLFEDMIPIMLFSYSNGYSESPIDRCNTVLYSNLYWRSKDCIFLSHNLLFETLINEGVASAESVSHTADNKFVVHRESMLPQRHTACVHKLHTGARLYFEDRLQFENPIKFNPNAFEFLFSTILKKPSISIVNSLSDLAFDNKFAGKDTEYFVSTKEHPSPKAKYLWPEGNLTKETRTKTKIITTTKSLPAKKENAENNFIKRLISFVVLQTAPEKKVQKFKKNPKAYFADSKNSMVRKLSYFF